MSDITPFINITHFLISNYNSIQSNQWSSVLISSIALYAGRRLTVDKAVIHPIFTISLNIKKEMYYLKEVITDWELNDRERTQQFFDKYNEYNRVHDHFIKLENSAFFGDIALVKVKNRIIPVFNDSHYIVNGICLPKSHIINERNETLFFEGMGMTDPSSTLTNRLKKGMTVYEAVL